MNEKQTYTEKVFDNFFKTKERIDYNSIDSKPGFRDKKVMQALLNYKINGKRCLDIGPGTGRWLHFLKNNGASFLGAIDISQESLNRYSDICDKTQKANVEKDVFDFESNSFDIVISFMILEHLRDPALFISEIIRVSKNGGIVLITIPNIVSLISRIRMLLGFLPQAVSSDKTHVRFYTLREMKKLFESYSVDVERVPTSFSVHPVNNRKFRLPSNKLTTSLDDHSLFKIRVIK